MKRKIVAKVGGSLFDLPDLRERLTRWLEKVQGATVLFISGGGALADGIRQLHLTHHLPEETSHWFAIRTMSVNAHFLGALLNLPVLTSIEDWTGNATLDPFPMFQGDEGQPGSLPHNWKVTSDSMAARVAQLLKAELMLLKSAPCPDFPDWEAISQTGFVDRYFPEVIRAGSVAVGCVNLRNGHE